MNLKNAFRGLLVIAFILFGIFAWVSIVGRLQDPLVDYYGQVMTNSEMRELHQVTHASPSLHCVQLTSNPFDVAFACFNTWQEADAFM